VIKRLSLALIVLTATVFMAACPKDPYGACEKAAADVGTGIGQAMKTVDTLRVNGEISPAEESNVLGYLEFANVANGSFSTCAQQVHTAGTKVGGYTACVNTFSTALANPQELALIHVTNPSALQEIQNLVNGLSTGLTALTTSLGGQ
jgi:hypothetical protein